MVEGEHRLYAVSIRYPRKQGEDFNFPHWADVHMPLGIATFARANGIIPRQVMVQHETFGMDGTPGSADAYATVWLLFETRAGLDGFMKLHNDPLASAELAEDFGNYAPLPPHVVLGEVTVFNAMDAVLEHGQSLLRSAKQRHRPRETPQRQKRTP
jgi:hypothetical protein